MEDIVGSNSPASAGLFDNMSCPEKIDHKLKRISVVRIRLKTSFPPKIYAESLKKQVVREYENGLMNKDHLMRKLVLLEKCGLSMVS